MDELVATMDDIIRMFQYPPSHPQGLQDGEGFMMTSDPGRPDDLIVDRVNSEMLAGLGKDETLLKVVGPVTSVSQFPQFCNNLEFKYFHPDNARVNDEFVVYYVRWAYDQGFTVPWIILQIPFEKKDVAFREAAEMGFRLSDGIPVLMGYGSFPCAGDTVFTMWGMKPGANTEPVEVDPKTAESHPFDDTAPEWFPTDINTEGETP